MPVQSGSPPGSRRWGLQAQKLRRQGTRLWSRAMSGDRVERRCSFMGTTTFSRRIHWSSGTPLRSSRSSKRDKIFARGSTDNKGQIFAHMLGIESVLKERGDLPVNLVVLVEGEEEIGSPHLEAFLREHKSALQADVVAISDTGMAAPGVPTFTYGLRGILCLEIRLRGPAADLHSGIFGGSVANPATVLSRMVAKLHDDCGRVAIPGFYDRVLPLEDWERDLWTKLPLHRAKLAGYNRFATTLWRGGLYISGASLGPANCGGERLWKRLPRGGTKDHHT